jgi:hypothetical protein
MARISLVEPENAPPEVKEIYEKLCAANQGTRKRYWHIVRKC